MSREGRKVRENVSFRGSFRLGTAFAIGGVFQTKGHQLWQFSRSTEKDDEDDELESVEEADESEEEPEGEESEDEAEVVDDDEEDSD